MGDVGDGVSYTILIGETLPAEHKDYFDSNRGWASRWANASCTTIIPPNWPISTDATCSSDPLHARENWAVSIGFKSKHGHGVNFASADGSVHYLRDNIDYLVYQSLGGRNDGG